MSRPAVFFDRDGTLMEEVEYCSDPARVRVYPGVPEALARLRAAGFATFVVSNQSGIGRGYFTDAQYHAVQAEMLRQAGGPQLFDACYYCPDAPGVPSSRRKPEPGMVLEAAAAFDIDLAASFFVGDKAVDVECGRRAGTGTVQVTTGYGNAQAAPADHHAADVVAAIDWILGLR
jgi:D-glycero-D-manno-heptose 1,7-bisphosphate phosphatase